ncbi:MAG TPA: helix-turn-helix transcriptional regulator, partial [Acidimicrobiales bacterium]|nr:helix-turn-helix transcriptional regulator [Acidimicrobiales bacterium]
MLSGPMPVATGDDFAHWVRCWRHANRWTQERLAEALGYEVSYVAKIERGQRRVSRQFVARLAEVVAVDIAQLEQMARRPTAKLR